MSYWLDRFDEIAEQLNQEDTSVTIEGIPAMTLSEFARRDIAVEIYSEVLGCNLWLCSNNEMATQIKKDSPGAVCYTVEELRQLVILDPDHESLKRIHEVKELIHDSKIKKSMKRGSGEPFER